MTIDNDPRVLLAEDIAASWNSQEIPYVVANGLANYPTSIGRDLDVVIRSLDVPSAVAIAKDIASGRGYSSFERYSSYGLLQLVFWRLDKGEMVSLPIDFLDTSQVWRSKIVSLVSPEQVLASDVEMNGPFKTSPFCTFLKNILRPLLCGDYLKAKSYIEVGGKLPHEIIEHLSCHFGSNTARDIYDFVSLKSPWSDEGIIRSRNQAMRQFAFRHPLECIRNICRMVTTRLSLWLTMRPNRVLVLSGDCMQGEQCDKRLIELGTKAFLDIEVIKIKAIEKGFSSRQTFWKCLHRLRGLWQAWGSQNKRPVSEWRVMLAYVVTSARVEKQGAIELLKIHHFDLCIYIRKCSKHQLQIESVARRGLVTARHEIVQHSADIPSAMLQYILQYLGDGPSGYNANSIKVDKHSFSSTSH